MSKSVAIIGTESLGVRGLSCFVKAGKRRIIIDPGVALGYLRHGLLPHPLQVAEGRFWEPELLLKLLNACHTHVPVRLAEFG